VNVAVVGLGYVGAVTAACLAELGHTVTGIDVDEAKVDSIRRGESPIVEPRLAALIEAAVASKRLRAATEPADVLRSADVVVVCVGTPARGDGTVNLEFVERAVAAIGREIARSERFQVVAVRSTVPPGTTSTMVRPVLEQASGRVAGEAFGLAMVPEFLREGSGVEDFFEPPFTVVGTEDDRSFEYVAQLLAPLERPIHRASSEAAESLKYVCNAFHAVKVSFANEIGRLLSALGVDSREVMDLFRQDTKLNISGAYLRPGFAFGGSCLPKDLRALLHLARVLNVETPVLRGALGSNEAQLQRAARRVLDTGERHAALLGLSFKPETDDLRESPYVELAETLLGKGMQLKIFDPVVNPDRLTGANRRYVETRLPHLNTLLVASAKEAVEGSGVVIAATADRDALRAIVHARPRHVIDLHGGLGDEVEELPGYEGVAW
jgi:GDP-mannose 6-dehydrogenase